MLNRLAMIYYRNGLPKPALKQWDKVLQLQPDNLMALNFIAWIRATRRDPAFYHPGLALELAQRACAISKNKNPVFLDTLAAAYAANGQFDRATQAAQKAMELMRSQGQTAAIPKIQKRLELYQANKPYIKQ